MMVLLDDIKQFMMTSRVTTLGQLLEHFSLDEGHISDLRFKLKHWIDKGYLIQVACTLSCGKQCQQCALTRWTERYQWIDSKNTS
jgi:hypothetical protein